MTNAAQAMKSRPMLTNSATEDADTAMSPRRLDTSGSLGQGGSNGPRGDLRQ